MLTQVTTLTPVIIFLIVMAVALGYAFLYYKVMGSNFKLSFLMLAVALIFITTTAILKQFAFTATFTFSSSHIIFFDGKEMYTYIKEDIVALYSINYLSSKSSKIAFELILARGKQIYLSDIKFADRRDKTKNKLLKKFLTAFCDELHFTENTQGGAFGLNRIGKAYYTRIA